MPEYYFANLKLSTPFTFPELEALTNPALTKEFLTISEPSDPRFEKPSQVSHKKLNFQGEPWLNISKINSGFYFSFVSSNVATQLDLDKHELYIVDRAGCSPAYLNHLILDHIIPLYLSTQGYLVLHASLVENNSKAFLFLGPSSSGKSSLAASLLSRGFNVLSDDYCLLSKDLTLIPSYPSLRILPEDLKLISEDHLSNSFSIKELSNKRNISLPPTASKPKLEGFFILSPSENAEAANFTDLGLQERIISLVRSSFLLDPSSTELSTEQFEIASKVATDTEIKLLSYNQTKTTQDGLADSFQNFISS